jgi:hypothetical protein
MSFGTTFPLAVDDDSNIPRVDDNLSDIGGDAINALRSATFAIEKAIGVVPNGTKNSLTDRLAVSLNDNGTIKASALTSIGLVTLPITNVQVGSNAGISESKLSLTHTTSDLYTLIQANSTLINSVSAFLTITSSNLIGHVAGASLKQDGTSNRHVASHIDLNTSPVDARDISYVWGGLLDKDGVIRAATTVAAALLSINNDLTGHENSISGAHVASAVSVITDNFQEIPSNVTDVQKLADYLDDNEITKIGEHRATQHSNGIPTVARSQSLISPDGYREVVVPPTSATTYLVRSPSVSPVDSISNGDDVIKFVPNDAGFVFDSQFKSVMVGDTIRVNYGNGVEAAFLIDSIRYVPGSEWVVRINGTNLYDSLDGYALARIDRSRYDSNTSGVLAVAAANATPSASFGNILSGLIVGDARAAGALGLGFDSGQLDATHYNLWLELYPTGNPSDRVVAMPSIDVTGNAGITPGNYTLNSIVSATNNALRQIGYNLRFMAYQYNGEFGIKLTDAIGSAGFAIIKGTNSSGTLAVGSYTNNVISEVGDSYDALGFGILGSNQASPAYQSSFLDATAAQLPTIVLTPLKNRSFVVNGQKRDTFAPTYLATKDGYWDGYISARTAVGIFTVETTYHIPLDLKAAGLKPGRTITIEPSVAVTDASFFDVDYGRFIIKSVYFPAICPGVPQSTEITVINGLHGFGSGFGFSSSPSLPVRVHFGYDSVGFDNESILDQSPTAIPYRRHHEVYVSQDGKTFSHERGRLPIQTEDAQPSWLATTKFHIKEISPKLRGYRDASATQYNKYIRLYVLSYNSTSGEFDGYLGQRFTSANVNITNVGPVVRGRKNVTTRFYDETNVDYIDFEFSETASPGTSVLTTAAARFVDIEVFPSLRLDEEIMLLATAEVNWSPQTGNDTVQWVADKRSFGSISEEDLTDTTLLAVSAGDRYLHQNGVIRGLNLDTISTVANSGEIFFKGGVALVNGRIVPCNNTSVTIPKVYPNGTALPQSLTWAICVNERGNLQSVLLTTTKQQSFVTIGAGNYLVPSCTFQELIDVRKELTVLATASVTVASLTINSVTDVRRIVLNGTGAMPLTWAGDNQQSANFQSFAALKNWIVQYGSVKNRVKVMGDVPITTTIDLTGFAKEVLIDGSEGSFTVTANKGVLVGSNVTLDSCTFSYLASGLSFVAGDEINSGNGCIFGAAGTNISNLTIKNCTFTYASAGQRPPFINLEMNKAQVNDKIKILDNTFTDITPSNENQAAVAIFSLNAGAGTDPAVLSNSILSRNVCSHKQGIYVTVIKGAAGPELPGLNVVNSTIEENSCGKIGHLTSAYPNTLASQTQVDRSQGLTIRNNTCLLIAQIYGNSSGLAILTAISHSTGPISIENNKCSWIFLVHNEDNASNQYSSAKIVGNQLTSSDVTIVPAGINNNYAITVSGILFQSQVIIDNNSINFGRLDGITYSYNSGIYCLCSANITNNIVKGLAANSIGIIIASSGAVKKRTIITGNQIYRASATIIQYIFLSGTDTEGICSGNYFDDFTVDGAANTQAVTTPPPVGWVVERNKNQTVSAKIQPTTGQIGIRSGGTVNPVLAGVAPNIAASYVMVRTDIFFSYGDPTKDQYVNWFIPIDTVLPPSVKLISASVSVYCGLAASTRNATMWFSSDSLGPSVGTSVVLTLSPQTLTHSTTGYTSSPTDGAFIVLELELSHATLNNSASAGEMTVTYRW